VQIFASFKSFYRQFVRGYRFLFVRILPRGIPATAKKVQSIVGQISFRYLRSRSRIVFKP
jgi:hypothetical protein